jgi:hypothetical protein
MPGGPPPRLCYQPVRASGQAAVAAYLREPGGRRHVALALDMLTLDGPRIARVTAFRSPALLTRFGLPAELL